MIRSRGTGNFWYFVPVLIWGALVAYFTLIPSSQVPRSLSLFNDKFIHAAIYCTSGGLHYLGFIRYRLARGISRSQLLFTLIFWVIFGGLIEVIQQLYVPGRTGSWGDFAANAAGVVISIVFLRVLQAWTPRSPGLSANEG